jgi:hypothetical protein
LDQQLQYQQQGIWPTAGLRPNYIEDVFSTWLYTGTGGTPAVISNGIDLAGKGGLVWSKKRSQTGDHVLLDTARGDTFFLQSNTTNAQQTYGSPLITYGASGYTTSTGAPINENTQTYASWTFRKQPKFFDIVTYTGNGTSGRQIPHSLGSVPGCIIVKRTDVANNWYVYHRSLTNERAIYLDVTNAAAFDGAWANTDPTSTVFTVAGGGNTNGSGNTYVAYLFAHNAGGFGLTGTDNVVSCGSYTGNGSSIGPTITLGYEPQWVLIKRTTGLSQWILVDSMRGMTASGSSEMLNPNQNYPESNVPYIAPQSTGFNLTSGGGDVNETGNTYIYIAIRRGPMKVPTTGTSVFAPVAFAGDGTDSRVINTGKNFVTDWLMTWDRTSGAYSASSNFSAPFITRLTGFGVNPPYLTSTSTAAEVGSVTYFNQSGNNSQLNYTVGGSAGNLNSTGQNYIHWNFGRSPGFFDVVCYTGTTSVRTVAHNLAAVPELMIVKNRSNSGAWGTYNADVGTGFWLALNSTGAVVSNTSVWNNTAPTSSVFTVGGSSITNANGQTYVAYLFATCPGVSKVGSYTGTGTTQTINCGFAAGARFVLIKRTDSTGDWYVWDSARGIVAGNDPYLLLNSTAAEVTSTDYVDTAATGFEITSTAPAAINASGGSFIFLAIA